MTKGPEKSTEQLMVEDAATRAKRQAKKVAVEDETKMIYERRTRKKSIVTKILIN